MTAKESVNAVSKILGLVLVILGLNAILRAIFARFAAGRIPDLPFDPTESGSWFHGNENPVSDTAGSRGAAQAHSAVDGPLPSDGLGELLLTPDRTVRRGSEA